MTPELAVAGATPLYESGADDHQIEEALAWVEPPLLQALAQALGDSTVLDAALRPDLSQFDPLAFWTDEQRAMARTVARQALRRLRDAGGPQPPPDSAALRRIIEFVVDDRPVDDTLERFLRQELQVEGTDVRAPAWRLEQVAPGRSLRVAVVGAGMSGLLAAHRLDQAGVAFTVFEKDADVGGTWLENSYPGCRVDVANHLFSYSFAQRPDWPHLYSTRDALLDYFRDFADSAELRGHIRFATEVVAARWVGQRCVWELEVGGRDPGVETFDAVVMATGQLNRPKRPDIDGLDRFAGPSFHSARWDHSVDLAGKRVAVVGNGASAAQLVPEVAARAASLEVFQRTPNWFVPTADYHDEVPASQQWLFLHVPTYSEWYRFWLFWRSAEALLPACEVDPAWSDRSRAVGPVNDLVRAVLTEYIEAEFADRPDLLAQVLPQYPPGSKRMLRDNGIWARTLKRDHVSLVTAPITGIVADGIETADGVVHPADVIVYATGFTASEFLMPVQIVGRDGVDLHEHWAGDARAHLGVTIPSFPNLFCLYGPNTNIVVNGSIIFFSECAVGYVVDCIRLLASSGATAMEVRRDVHDEFNRRVDEANARRVWGVATVSSWYRNATGRSAQNWPFGLLDYWAATRSVDPADFALTETSSALA